MPYTPIPASIGASDLSAVTGVIKSTAGVLSAASPALDYFSPIATASVASATTITLPATGGLIALTGSTQVDFITKPAGDAPRLACILFGSNCGVRESVAGAGAGTTNINIMSGGTVNVVHTFLAGSYLLLYYDGAQWRRWDNGAPRFDGTGVIGNSATAKVDLNNTTGARLQYGTAQSVLCDGSTVTITAPTTTLTTRPKYTKAVVASATQVTLTAGCPMIEFSGNTTINTFVSTGWTVDMRVSFRFQGVLTLTHNSGGTNDFMTNTGANITTSASMVLDFVFDGTDMVEVGR